MKTGKHILLLIFLLASFISINAQSNDLNRKLRRAQTQIQKLQKTIHHIQNPEIQTLYTEAQNLLDQAWSHYHNGRFGQSGVYLTQVNTKLIQIWRKLKSTPIFNRKYLSQVEKTLNKAERQVRSSNNQTANYYLDQAYSFKRQGMNLIQSSDGQFVNGVELLFMSERFAKRAIELSSNNNQQTDENNFEIRFNDISNQIKRYKSSGNHNLIHQEINNLEKALFQARKLYNRGNIPQSNKILNRVENKMIEIDYAGKFKLNAAKLFRQFQLQKTAIAAIIELSDQNEIVTKLINRIENNLEMIEAKFVSEAFIQCEKLLKTNHQLIRTLKRMIGNQAEDISKNLARKIEQLEKQLIEIGKNTNFDSGESDNYLLAQHFLQKAKVQNENNRPLISAIYLRTVYKFLDLVQNPSQSNGPQENNSPNAIEAQYNKILNQVNILPESNEKELIVELTNNIKSNLDKNNIEAAKILISIANESLSKTNKK